MHFAKGPIDFCLLWSLVNDCCSSPQMSGHLGLCVHCFACS